MRLACGHVLVACFPGHCGTGGLRPVWVAPASLVGSEAVEES